jgi:hypothetical protein
MPSPTWLTTSSLPEKPTVGSNNDHPGQTAGLPFVRPIIRSLVEEVFREQAQWKSRELVDRIVQLHRERGGVTPPDPSLPIRRVLQDLRDEGAVVAPGHGWWRWNGDGAPETGIPEDQVDEPQLRTDELISDLQPAIQVEKELGSGSECVYLYFNPNDRRLAELEGRASWECKIGRTSSCDSIGRILGQGIKTSLSRLPTVGLVLRTDDSAALEKAVHASLRLVGADVPDSPGSEWFMTSPAQIEAWYACFQKCLEEIRPGTVTP